MHCIWNLATCSSKNGQYLPSTIDDSVFMCDEIINAFDSVSANMSSNVTCTVPINALNTASTNFNNKKVGFKMNYCSLHTVLLLLILLLIIAIFVIITQSIVQDILTH